MYHWWTTTGSLLLIFLLNSCGNSYKTLVVAPQTIECTGVITKQCLKVREANSEKWEYLYENIQAFDHQEGYEYKIKVRVKELKNPPQDASSIVYTLVEILSKEKAAPVFGANKIPKDKELQRIVYEATTRGFFLHIEITEQQIELYRAVGVADPIELAITPEDWKELVTMVKALELDDPNGLIPPTNDRERDAASAAELHITYKKGAFSSPIFDHKKPPPALEKLVNHILSMTEGID